MEVELQLKIIQTVATPLNINVRSSVQNSTSAIMKQIAK